MVSQKCQYALRAVFELAKAKELLTIEAIARRQQLPERFLEGILNQLRGGGFVASRRGRRGGYLLVRDPAGLAVGEIIRFVDGPLGAPSAAAPRPDRTVFLGLWRRAREEMEQVYDGTTVADLLAEDRRCREQPQPLDYAI